MKMLTRRGFTAAGILAALSAGAALLPGCDATGCSGPFEPSQNEIECVYGPPPEDVEDNGSDDDLDDVFDPSSNEQADVYGPPIDDVDSYDPDENMMAIVYGPPSDTFEGSQGADG